MGICVNTPLDFYNGILGVIVLINFTKNRLYYYFYQPGGYIICIFSVTYLSFKDIIISNQFYANIILSYIPSNNVILGLRLPRLLWNWLIDCIYLYFSVHENFLVFHLCVFLPCDLTSWILKTVTRDKYQSLVTVIVFDGCFHARMESKSLWFNSRKIDILCYAFATPLIYLGIWLC